MVSLLPTRTGSSNPNPSQAKPPDKIFPKLGCEGLLLLGRFCLNLFCVFKLGANAGDCL